MPFGIAVEVETLFVFVGSSVTLPLTRCVLTTSRTFSGGALITIDVCSVALNHDITCMY